MKTTKNNLFNIYSRTSGALTGAMGRESVIAIYRTGSAFITLANEDGTETFYYVTAEGGLRKIEGIEAASREAKSLDILRRNNGYESREDGRRRRLGVALAPDIHRAA